MKENPDDRQHATLSPSTAERWFNCPGSLRLSRGKRSVSGAAALLGSEAHDFAADILIGDKELSDIEDDDMRTAVGRYTEFVNTLESGYAEEYDWMVEDKIDLRHLGGDCWGTLDYASWVIGRDLYVCDYKNGIVTVEAPGNKQLKIYALGVLEKIGYDFEHVYICIVQPRAAHVNGPIRSQRLTPADFKTFKKELKTAMKETQNVKAKLKSGSWCQYCPAVGLCPEIVGTAQELARVEFGKDTGRGDNLPDIVSITDDQLTRIVEHTRAFRAWLDACQQEAVDRLSEGAELHNLKLVRAPGRTRWRDPSNLPTEYTKAVPITITEARKLFDDVDDYTERPEGSIVAAEVSDGRALYVSPRVEFK